MSMKYPNPTQGYLPCPVCGERSSVHQVGEGKRLAMGDTTSPSTRNTGLLYYACPECGNANASRTLTRYIQDRMTPTEHPSHGQ